MMSLAKAAVLFLSTLSWGSAPQVSFPTDLVAQINGLKNVGELVQRKRNRSPALQKVFEANLRGLEGKPLPKLKPVDEKTIEVGEGTRSVTVRMGSNPGEMILNGRSLQMSPETEPTELWDQVAHALPKKKTGAVHWLWSAVWAAEEVNASNDSILAAAITEMRATTASWFGCGDVTKMVENCEKFVSRVKKMMATPAAGGGGIQGLRGPMAKFAEMVDLKRSTDNASNALETFWSDKNLNNWATCGGKEGRGKLMACRQNLGTLQNQAGNDSTPEDEDHRKELTDLIKQTTGTIDRATGHHQQDPRESPQSATSGDK